MRVLPLPLVRCAVRAFPEKLSVQHLPDIQHRLKLDAYAFTQAKSEGSQSPRCLGFRPFGDVFLDRLHLVELATLDDDAAGEECLSHALSPINHRDNHSASRGSEGIEAGDVVLNTL